MSSGQSGPPLRQIDHGILTLRSQLCRKAGPLEVICDALIGSLAERYEDDVTVVLARIPRQPVSPRS